ncbi:MAG TPA: hypothetical protein VGS16_12235 [Candidatus Dormibacteraeota bacterium]|nr:hypothetical protein [Candidatus Dormibacteraeota bacterium]
MSIGRALLGACDVIFDRFGPASESACRYMPPTLQKQRTLTAR